jgi:hypothetical protein
MPSGSFSKRARNTDSLVNRKNCGGPKKAGLGTSPNAPTIFYHANKTNPTVNYLNPSSAGLPCPESYSNNPGGQCSGGVGAIASTRNRGCKRSC